jgi:hypothetical protein
MFLAQLSRPLPVPGNSHSPSGQSQAPPMSSRARGVEPPILLVCRASSLCQSIHELGIETIMCVTPLFVQKPELHKKQAYYLDSCARPLVAKNQGGWTIHPPSFYARH